MSAYLMEAIAHGDGSPDESIISGAQAADAAPDGRTSSVSSGANEETEGPRPSLQGATTVTQSITSQEGEDDAGSNQTDHDAEYVSLLYHVCIVANSEQRPR